MSLTTEQVQEIEQTIITLADSYLGLPIGPATAPLIGAVQDELLKTYRNVKVHLSYSHSTGRTSVDALVDFTKVSVVFSPTPL